MTKPPGLRPGLHPAPDDIDANGHVNICPPNYNLGQIHQLIEITGKSQNSTTLEFRFPWLDPSPGPGPSRQLGEMQPIRADCSRNGRISIAVPAILGKELLGMGRAPWGMGTKMAASVKSSVLGLSLIASVGALLSLAPLSGASAATNLVNNGGFETGDFTGWTLGPVSYPAEVVQWAAYEGIYGAQIAGYASGPNKLSQTFSTANGQFYDLSFWYLQDVQVPNGFDVTWNGSSLFSSVNDVVGSWRYFSAQVLGSGSDQLLFTAYNDHAFTRVDSVSLSAAVSAVPEPATWAMMIIGFGAVGSMVRTSRRRNVLLAA